jgi:hypothetical protein
VWGVSEVGPAALDEHEDRPQDRECAQQYRGPDEGIDVASGLLGCHGVDDPARVGALHTVGAGLVSGEGTDLAGPVLEDVVAPVVLAGYLEDLREGLAAGQWGEGAVDVVAPISSCAGSISRVIGERLWCG